MRFPFNDYGNPGVLLLDPLEAEGVKFPEGKSERDRLSALLSDLLAKADRAEFWQQHPAVRGAPRAEQEEALRLYLRAARKIVRAFSSVTALHGHAQHILSGNMVAVVSEKRGRGRPSKAWKRDGKKALRAIGITDPEQFRAILRAVESEARTRALREPERERGRTNERNVAKVHRPILPGPWLPNWDWTANEG